MDKICYDCLESSNKLIWDNGFRVCQKCFHKRYSRKKYVKPIQDDKVYSIKELKDHLEKNW